MAAKFRIVYCQLCTQLEYNSWIHSTVASCAVGIHCVAHSLSTLIVVHTVYWTQIGDFPQNCQLAKLKNLAKVSHYTVCHVPKSEIQVHHQKLMCFINNGPVDCFIAAV